MTNVQACFRTARVVYVCFCWFLCLSSKGNRAQIDRDQYKTHMQREILSIPNLTVLSAAVEDLSLSSSALADDGSRVPRVTGIVLGETLLVHVLKLHCRLVFSYSDVVAALFSLS